MAIPSDSPRPAPGPGEPVEYDAPARTLLVEGAEDLMGCWDQAQSAFVDDPRRAVQEGRELVEEVLQQLAQTFGDEHARLEASWAAGAEPSTEDLRQSLNRYREFFHRLLAA